MVEIQKYQVRPKVMHFWKVYFKAYVLKNTKPKNVLALSPLYGKE